ncbi:MAG: hypothetical protein ED859_14500 [Desulfuromonadales bacterium]|nr:MAG: hypothetical protein ED859_14500 [Desulfuromonadales bacterium]
MNPTANCRRIPSRCRVCNRDIELLQAFYYAVDRNGEPIYPAKCCSCGGLNVIVPLGNTGSAIVSSFEEIPTKLREMMQKGVDRFGFDEGTE